MNSELFKLELMSIKFMDAFRNEVQDHYAGKYCNLLMFYECHLH